MTFAAWAWNSKVGPKKSLAKENKLEIERKKIQICIFFLRGFRQFLGLAIKRVWESGCCENVSRRDRTSHSARGSRLQFSVVAHLFPIKEAPFWLISLDSNFSLRR